MKRFSVLILIILSCAAATWLHYIKIQLKETETDKTIAILTGLQKVLTRNESINVKLVNCGSELYFLARDALVPHTVLLEATGLDTSLIIMPKATPDSISKPVLSNNKILWQNRDGKYYYALTIPDTTNAKR